MFIFLLLLYSVDDHWNIYQLFVVFWSIWRICEEIILPVSALYLCSDYAWINIKIFIQLNVNMLNGIRAENGQSNLWTCGFKPKNKPLGHIQGVHWILSFFLNSASSAAALVFYLPCVCTNTDNEGKQRKARVRNIFEKSEKAQYLMNTL